MQNPRDEANILNRSNRTQPSIYAKNKWQPIAGELLIFSPN
jgi:hypothetical protein